jgi:hypothetical protein
MNLLGIIGTEMMTGVSIMKISEMEETVMGKITGTGMNDTAETVEIDLDLGILEIGRTGQESVADTLPIPTPSFDPRSSLRHLCP